MAGWGPREDPEPLVAVFLLRRGEGLGPRVARRLIREASDEGAQAARAITWAENAASRRMLDGLGFEQIGLVDADWARASELTWLEHRLELKDQ